MPINVAGVTVADIKEDLGIPASNTARDALIQRLLNGALDYLERRTRREFGTGVATRLFDGADKGYLLTDDFQIGSITRIAVLNPDRSAANLIATGNVATSGEAWNRRAPYHNRIDILNYTSENPYRIIGRSPYIFPRGIQNIEITANWGTWATLPDGLADIVRSMVSVKTQRPVGGVRSMSVGGESLSFSDDDLTKDEKRQLREYSKDMAEIF